MTDFPSYSFGTVSVANGAVAIVGDGTIWTGTAARAGDTIVIGTNSAVIVDVTDDTHLKIDAWPFTTVTAGTSYKIVQNSPLRFVGGQAMADVSALIGILRANGLLWYLPAGYTDPNDVVPELTAEEGQAILKIDTGALWVMRSGSWVSAGVYKGFNFLGAYDSLTAYVINDVVTSAGNTYLVTAATTGNTPPNASYYSLLASKGDAATIAVGTVTTGAGGSSASVTNSGTVNAAVFDFTIPAGKAYGGTSTTSLAIGTGSKAFTTQSGLAYTDGARVRASSAANTANWMEGLATYSGTTLTITVTKTGGSGTLADWNLNVVGEPGAGDLTSANNLSDLADATTALTNLGGTTVGKEVFKAADAAAARAAIGANVGTMTPQGRLSLISGTSVMTTTTSSAAIVYYTLATGNLVPIYDGTNFVPTVFAELSNTLANSSTGKAGPAAVANSSVYDLFVWNDSGTVRLTRGTVWTDTVTPSAGTALTLVNGIWLNSVSITNGPAASRGTYVGTVITDGLGGVTFQFGSSAAGGGLASFGLWNMYNRVLASTMVKNSTDSWTYATALTWRAPNASTTYRCYLIRRFDIEPVNATYYACCVNGASTNTGAGVGLDSTTAFSGFPSSFGGTTLLSQSGRFSGMVGVGLHYLTALEYNSSATSSTWYGDAGLPTTLVTGFLVEFWY